VYNDSYALLQEYYVLAQARERRLARARLVAEAQRGGADLTARLLVPLADGLIALGQALKARSATAPRGETLDWASHWVSGN
jgi:hypothetical protein